MLYEFIFTSIKNIYPLTKYILLENKIEKGRIIKEYTNLLYNLISKNNISTRSIRI